MPQTRRRTSKPKHTKPTGISSISVQGYKSLAEEQRVEIRPLTILAGANSAGKSSLIQPLLLLKQTLEAPYDPGALLLDGPNIRFTSAEQLLTRKGRSITTREFTVGVQMANAPSVRICFARQQSNKRLAIKSMSVTDVEGELTFTPSMSDTELNQLLDSRFGAALKDLGEHKIIIERSRCFLGVELVRLIDKDRRIGIGLTPVLAAQTAIQGIIHVPGLRGNPERTYGTTAVGSDFPGTFERYVASVIAQWQSGKDHAMIRALEAQLAALGLTSKIEAKSINDTQVELRVGRAPHLGGRPTSDTVSIADVGFGVSQTLPVLVALLIARPGQIVYLEQPEIHLHPRAQYELVRIVADAARRGVRVILETHSSLLLRGIQTAIAERYITPDLAILHWCTRDPQGYTNVSPVEFDEDGAYGDCPIDFDDVALRAEMEYLNAVEDKAGSPDGNQES